LQYIIVISSVVVICIYSTVKFSRMPVKKVNIFTHSQEAPIQF